jgi:hypothetical protein
MKPEQKAHRKLVYTDIGHGPRLGTPKYVVPFYMSRGEHDIVYLEPGKGHGTTPYGDFRSSDILGRIDKKTRQIAVANVQRVDDKAAEERLKYAVSILAMDWPGYEIWYFGSGGERRHGTRLKNPIAMIFDTDHPPADPDRALSFSGVYDERRRAIKAWHVTNDARRIMEMVEAGMPLVEMGGEYKEQRELGPGLYMSAVPQLWMGRATKKWEFLEHLDHQQREVLALALGKVVLEQRQTGYITESEYKMANRDLEVFVEDGNNFGAIQVAGQPYNIAFWRPSFLTPLGIKPGPTPETVEFLVKGIFAVFDNQPRTSEIKGLLIDEFDGCCLRGGLMTVAQMVVWRNEAIAGMKKARL